MEISKSAQNAIVEVMRKKKLDPSLWLLEITVTERQAVGLTFSKGQNGQKFGELRIFVDPRIEDALMLDYEEERKGLIFKFDKG